MHMEGRLVWATSDCKHWQEPTCSRGCSFASPCWHHLWLHTWAEFCDYTDIVNIHGTTLGDLAPPVSVPSLSGHGMETTEKNIGQHHILHGAVRLSSFLKAGSVSVVQKATGIAATTDDPCTVIKTFHSNANLATIRQAVMTPLFLSYF